MRVELRLVSESSSMSGKDLEGEDGGRSGDQKWQHCSGLDTGGGSNGPTHAATIPAYG